MRALVITEHGPPDVMRVQERPDPEPGRGQVRVRVRAAGVNFADLLARVGLYPDAPKPPCVVGYEIAGDVDALGEGVEGIELGQRVMGGSRFGGYAQLAVTGTDALVPMPDGWSYAEGAALPVTYATAYAIRGFGVDHPIDYRTHDVVDEVRRVAGEDQPIDLAFDAIGGRSFKQSFSLLRPGGRLVCFGASEVQAGERRSPLRAVRVVAQMPRFNPLKLMRESKSVIGLNMLQLWDAAGSLEEYVAPLREWLAESRIRPVVAREFRLDDGAEAHRYVHERKNVGKVVLTL